MLVRCVYLTNQAFLSGFTLTNGAGDVGGGLWCASIDAAASNCVFTYNYSTSNGGGATGGTLVDCTFSTNGAEIGGAASSSTLCNCVLNGNYASGGGGAWSSMLIHCILAGNNANGDGGGADYCVLTNCVLSANSATSAGGGAAVCSLNACTLSNNSAGNYGGAAYGGSLINCLLTGNEAWAGGGAAYVGLVMNCTLTDNSAVNGGGVFGVNEAINCVLYYNTATSYPNYNMATSYPYFAATPNLTNCCTTPTPSSGIGNITNDPVFVNLTNGDFHLQSTSPCINSGNNAYVASSTDLDGNPRIVGGTVDIGAYEFQNPASIVSYAWLQQYNLPTDGSADYADSDGTGMANWQKWIAGLNPTNPASVLVMTSAASSNASSGITVSWQSVITRTYYLQRASNLATQPAFSAIQSNLVGQVGTTSYTDASATNGIPYFYRVGVQ